MDKFKAIGRRGLTAQESQWDTLGPEGLGPKQSWKNKVFLLFFTYQKYFLYLLSSSQFLL
jgi:hypothetical protein